MAKNISKNQWFKDIVDDVYINTAVINDILIVSVSSKGTIKVNTTIAKARDPNLFNFLGKEITIGGNLIMFPNGELMTIQTASTTRLFMIAPLKTKQLETDFYSPEQLAEMHPGDPAYQVATPGIMNDDIPDKENSEPTIEPTIGDTEPTITSEVSNNDEPY